MSVGACRGLPKGGSTQRLVAVIIWSLQIDQPISQLEFDLSPCRRPARARRLGHGGMDEWFKSHAWKACVG